MSGPFNVGDVVVCVDDAPSRDWLETPGYALAIRQLSKGEIYRVEAVTFWDGWADGTGQSVVLEGVHEAPLDPNFPDCPAGWSPNRFRHLPRATEEFTQQMRALRPTKEQVT